MEDTKRNRKNEGNRWKNFRIVKGDLEIEENPFNISLEKFSFLKKGQIQTPRTKSLVYKVEYSEEQTTFF